MTVIGSASINIRADDKYFEPDVRRAVAKIKDLRIALKVDADMSAANKKLRDLRYRVSKQEVAIKIRANDVAFEADVRAAVRKIKNVTIDLKADVDSSKASKKIRDLRYRITSKPAILKVDANVAKAEEKMRKLLEKFTESTVNIHAKAHTGAAHTALSDLQTRYGKNVNYTATADTKVARAALALVARNRRAKITAFIDPTTSKALQGAFNTLTGTLPFDKIRTALSGVVANFEGLAVKAGMVSTALLSIGAAALTAGANIFSIGGDITQVVGIAAMLPAAFMAMGVAIATTKMAWKGFGEALSSDPKKAAKAMAELPPEAQKAADGVRGLGKEIQKATQAKFWEALGTSLQDMVTNLLPQAKEGFEYVGAALGTLQAVTFDNISKGLGDGVLLGIMTNIGDMFTNMTKGVGDFIQGFITLGSVGATYLPQFGTYLGDAGTKFGEFIRKADEAGKINDWIETAVRRFQELGSIVKSTVGIMSGLTEIARFSGAPGLTEMAEGFRNVAAVVNSEPFQGQLQSILEGAREGTTRLGEGLGTLTALFWNSADSVSAFLAVAGEIAGLTFENITKLFDGTGLGSGLYAALDGLKTAMGDLGPGFRDLGIAVGDIGHIAGELFRSMAPGLNMLAETIRDVVGGLRDGIIAAMPIFNAFAQAILDIASGPIVALATAIGDMLSTFSELPGVVQTVLMSLGLFLLLKPKFDKFFGGLAAGLTKEGTKTRKFFDQVNAWSADSKEKMAASSAGMGQSMRNAMDGAAQSAGGAYRAIRTGAGEMASEVKRVATVAGTSIASGIGSAVGATKRALAPLAGAVRNTLMDEGGMSDVKKGFQDLSTSATQKMGDITNAAKRTASGVKDTFRGGLGATRDQFRDMGTYAQGSFKQLSAAAKVEGTIVKNEMAKMARSVDSALGNIPSRAGTAFGDMGRSAGTALGNIGTRVQGVFSDIGNRAKTASGAVVGAFSKVGTQVGTSLSTIGTSASKMASGMSAAMAPARTAFTNLATHAATAGKAAASGMASGLKVGLGGLAGALGGVWGIALMGAIAALGAFATSNQKTKEHVDNLRASLDEQSGAFTQASQKVVAEALSADQKLLGIINQGSEFDTLKKAGVNLDTFMKAVDGSETALSDMHDQMDAVGEGATLNGQLIRNGIGGTPTMSGIMKVAGALGLMQTEGDKSTAILQKHKSALEAARVQEEAVAEAMGVATAAAGRLSANYAILEDTTSSVSEKTSALKSNLDLMNDGQSSALDAGSRYHETLRSTNDSLATMIANNGGVVTGLLGVGGAFDVTTAKGNDLYKAMQTQSDSILEMGMATMQAAINNGATLPEAQAQALLSMQQSTDAMKAHLQSVGFSAEDAQAILDQLGLKDDKLKGALVVDTKQAEMDLARAGMMANAVAEGNYEMVLAALPDEAKAALTETMDLGDKFKNGEYEAILKALDETPGGMEAAVLGLTTYAGKEWETHLKALNLVPEEVQKANEAAQALMPEANLDLVANDLATGILDNVAAYSLDGKTVDMTGNDLVTDILNNINSSNLMDKDSQLTTTDLVSQSIASLNATQLDGKISTLEAVDLASKVMQDVNQLTMDGKVSTLTANDLASLVLLNLNEVEFDDKEAEVMLRDSTKPGADSAKKTVNDAIGGMGGGLSRGGMGKITLDIDAEDNTAPAVGSAQGTMGGLTDVFRGLFGINNTGAATGEAQGTMGTLTDVFRGLFGINQTGAATGEAQGTMNTLYDVVRGLQAFNQTAGATAESQATMNTLQSVYRDLNAQNQTGGPLQASQATMNSLQNVMRDLQAQNLTGGAKGAAQGTMNSLQSVMRDLNANNLVGGPVGDAQGAINGVTGTEVDIVANDYASGPAENAAAAIGRVVGRTVDVVTNYISKVFNADGGFYNGDGEKVFANGGIMKSANNSAVQAFANGGISRGAQQQAVKAFAGGGTENHTAQIARGAWPVRIWAEPETGGEAYIPLSPNKRKRSLAILKEVMAEFGLEHLTHSFADGGLNKATRSSTPTVISSRYAAASTRSVSPVEQSNTQMAAPIINVHPSQGLNEEQIGVIASDRLWFNIQNSSF